MAPPILLGRDAPLAELRQALAQASARRGQLVLLSGEPGIGKSALADVLAREAGEGGAEVVLGRAWELAEAPPYFPVWACLRALGIEPPRGSSLEADAFHLWEQVLEALGRASAGRPVVWILEDLHAADHLTLDLLAFLARPLQALAVLLVGTRRDRDPHIGERTAARLARLARDGRELHLPRLTPDDRRALAESVAGGTLPPAVERELAERSDGNPLFVIECARAYRQGGATRLPASVRELTSERVALLPERTREALAAGAVVGRDFSAAIVARMQDGLPAQIIERLTPALRAGVIDELRPGQYRFSHILVRDGVEEDLPASRRALLHDRAERALAATGDSVDVQVERARHALFALRPDGVALALSAARTLESLGAHDRALAVYQRLEEAEAAGLAEARAGGEEALHRASVARNAGRYAEARQRCQAVMIGAKGSQDGALLARAALELGAELRPATVDRALVAALRDALAATTDATLRMRVQARLAAALQPAPDPQKPMELAREALAAARTVDDPATLLEVLLWAGAALVDYANLDERLALAQELLDLATRQGEPLRALVAISRLALDHAEAGQLDAFDADVERMRALSVELGHPRRRWKALFLQSMQAIARGDFEGSDRCLVEVQEHASVTDDPALAVTLLAHTGRRAVLFHRDDEVRRVLDEMPSIMDDIPEPDQVLGCVRAGALAHLEDVAGTARELPRLRGLPLAATDLRALLGEAVALCGDDAQREALHAQLLPEAHRHSVSGHVEMHYLGPVLRLLGLLGLSLGRAEEALAQLEEARRGARTRGHRLWVAQLSYDVGRASIAAGRPGEATAAFAEALAEAEALGMPGLAARTRARLQVAPAPLPRPPERVALVREGDVWRLERGARSVRVRHNRGLELLARLVERPGEEMHVLALASDSGASLVEADAGPALDPEARRAYQQRLRRLDEELEEAEAHHDAASHARLERERTALAGELTRAAGLHGRARPTASASERARVNVQRRLKDAVARVAEADAALGEFLSRALHTGTYCSFRP